MTGNSALHGWFLTLEGVEGAGKTTQAGRLERALSAHGYDVLLTREPGGTALGDAIRRLVLGGQHHPTAVAELFLMLADRAQHVTEVILPALEAGRIVIGDRFSDATRAYQGGGRGLDRELIETALAAATGGLEPDLTFLLDMPPERARKRLGETAGSRSDGKGGRGVPYPGPGGLSTGGGSRPGSDYDH